MGESVYSKALEDKVFACFDYVALSPLNMMTFSNNLCDLIKAIGDAITSLFDSFGAKNILECLSSIKPHCGRCFEMQTVAIDGKILIQPWDGVFSNQNNEVSSPFWWKEYQALKHHGLTNQEKATLQELLFILSAYFSISNCASSYSKCGKNSIDYILAMEEPKTSATLHCLYETRKSKICFVTKRNLYVLPKMYHLNKGRMVDSTELEKNVL